MIEFKEYVKQATFSTLNKNNDEEIDYNTNVITDGYIAIRRPKVFVYTFEEGKWVLTNKGYEIESEEDSIINQENLYFLNKLSKSIDLSKELTLHNSIEKIYEKALNILETKNKVDNF